jgi:2-desacetyl-2-hydroxyethyl bacteriochlorophyllide A dehydrogenase
MKAVSNKKAGPPEVLEVQEIQKPSPTDDEILVKIHTATVTRGDVVLRKLGPLMGIVMSLMGMGRKKIPGHEFAGEVVEVGQNVKRFKSGDKVFGTTTGLKTGANAEFVCVPEEWKMGVVAAMPANTSFEEAAAVPVGGMTALFLLEKAGVKPGQSVLIYGASGSVGTYAVQLAKHHFGAEVTGICSTKNLSLVQSLGADHVVDYTTTDIAETGHKFDVIFDAVGKTSKSKMRGLLKENGSYVSVKMMTSEAVESLNTLSDLLESGKIQPVIDKRFLLTEIVEAHRYVEGGHKVGNVVISVAE